jgi:hypothetical protein
MSNQKLCKDCKFCRKYPLAAFLSVISFGLVDAYEFARCIRPGKLNLTSGRVPTDSYCSCERVSYYTIDTCGEEAKYYEPRRNSNV